LTYAIDFSLSGLDPSTFRLTNILLHLLTTLLVLLLSVHPEQAVLFAAHPVHAGAVSSISGKSVLHNQLGVIYQRRGEIQKAARAYQKAIAPEMPIVHLHIGSLEEESGNTGQAIQHYERFLATWDLDPAITDKVRNNLTLLRRAS
jgi:tetratricopeptide (TPR) repeat protein